MIGSRRIYTVALVAAALVLAACAGGDVGGGGGDQGGGGGAAEISVAGVWTGTEQQNFEAVLDAFREETGTEWSYQQNADIGTFLGTQIEGGDPPDVALVPQPGLIRDLVAQDALTPIGEEATSNLEANYNPIWNELGSVDGTLYGVYFKAANKSTWWYNIGAFEQAGVQPPARYNEMLQTAQTVTQSGVPYLSVGAGDGWPLTDVFENIYLSSAGPETYDRLAEHRIPWTHPSVVAALETMGELFSNDASLAGGRKGLLETDFPTSVSQVFSDPPEAATVYEGDFVLGVITGETEAQPGQDADFFPFPTVDKPGVVGGGDAAVVLTDNPAAQELVAFLATPEAAEIWAREGGFTSPNRNVDPSVYPDDISRRIAQQVVEAQTFRFDMSDLQPAAFGATAGRGMWLRFQQFLETLDAQKTAKDLEADARKAYK
jgi:alpha-glucoside transport system substrate-binding protein